MVSSLDDVVFLYGSSLNDVVFASWDNSLDDVVFVYGSSLDDVVFGYGSSLVGVVFGYGSSLVDIVFGYGSSLDDTEVALVLATQYNTLFFTFVDVPLSLSSLPQSLILPFSISLSPPLLLFSHSFTLSNPFTFAHGRDSTSPNCAVSFAVIFNKYVTFAFGSRINHMLHIGRMHGGRRIHQNVLS